jgi:hypothetical protein
MNVYSFGSGDERWQQISGALAATGADMMIDIDKLTEAELIDLNHRVVERLRFLNQMRAHGEMLQFKIGDRVAFQPAGRPVVEGMLTRYNRRTVTVTTDSGQRWNVAPTLLRRVNSSGRATDPAPQVIPLRTK